MCGILGIISNRIIEENVFKNMLNSMTHRGPDESGTYCKNGVMLGIRRLSIIDIYGGSQPIFNEDRSLVIVFNGELYNFQELRAELVELGHHFKSLSDTEVVLHAFEEWGANCLCRFNGMFGFAIYDIKKRSLFLARDRIGIKPLFYSYHQGVFRFCSELRALTKDPDFLRKVDPLALDCYLSFGQIISPLSIYKHVSRLPAGNYLEYSDSKSKYKIYKYWDIPYEKDTSIGHMEANEEFRYRFKKAVKRRLIADVPLGAFLSGGVDSSCVVGQMARLGCENTKTFSMGFSTSGYDELDYARIVAKKHKTRHFEFDLSCEPLEIVNIVLDSIDEPLADNSLIPTYLLSREVRKHVKVALSGDGGDELFGGYDQYKAEQIMMKMTWMPKVLLPYLTQTSNFIPYMNTKKGIINKLKRFLNGLEEDSRLRHLRWMIYFPSKVKRELYTPDFLREINEFDSPFNYVAKHFNRYSKDSGPEMLTGVDLKIWLVDDILTKVDRMSMLNSLEVRVPFLDHEVVEFITRLPNSIRFQQGIKKGFCKNALKDLLPVEVIKRKEKQGFSFPLRIWAQGKLRDELSVYGINDLTLGGRLRKEKVQRIFDDNSKSSQNNTLWQWTLLILFRWFDNYLSH